VAAEPIASQTKLKKKAVHALDHSATVTGTEGIGELERMWKETVGYYLGICLGREWITESDERPQSAQLACGPSRMRPKF
jgi:hypothetical protein